MMMRGQSGGGSRARPAQSSAIRVRCGKIDIYKDVIPMCHACVIVCTRASFVYAPTSDRTRITRGRYFTVRGERRARIWLRMRIRRAATDE